MTALGTHLLLDLRRCDPQLLDDIAYLKEALIGAAEIAGATVLDERFHKFTPVGVTGFVLISESHLCVHTWPEHAYAAVDIFTCGSTFKAQQAAELIIDRLRCQNPSIREIPRGSILESEPTPA